MILKDANGSPISEGDTLYLIEDDRGAKAGSKFVVWKRKWEDDDEELSLVATIQPSKFLTALLTEESAKKYRVE